MKFRHCQDSRFSEQELSPPGLVPRNIGVLRHTDGVEAASDVRVCIEFLCQGIIAPMVESSFGTKKILCLLQ